jgi:hypothetical protein
MRLLGRGGTTQPFTLRKDPLRVDVVEEPTLVSLADLS